MNKLLTDFNDQLLLNRQKFLSEKYNNQQAILRSKTPFNFNSLFLGDNDRFTYSAGEILDKKEKIEKIQQYIHELNDKYKLSFLSCLDFLISDLDYYLTNNDNILKIVTFGLNCNLLTDYMKYVDHVLHTIDIFFKLYIFQDFLVFYNWPVIKKCNVDISNLYDNDVNDGDKWTEKIKFLSANLFGFYEHDIPMDLRIPDHRRMMNQKSKEVKFSLSSLNKNAKFFITKLMKQDTCIIEGFLNDFIIYNYENQKTFSLFILFAQMLQFQIDDILKRKYVLRISKSEKTFSMYSSIITCDTIPEVLVNHINIDIHIFISKKTGEMVIKKLSLNDFIDRNDNNFEFRNFRNYDGKESVCMVLYPSKFNYDNKMNLISDDVDDYIEGISFGMQNDSETIDSNSSMIEIINEHSDKKTYQFHPHSRSAFVDQKGAIIDQNDFGMSDMINEYNNQINGCINLFEIMDEKSKDFKNLTNGFIVDSNGEICSKSQMLVDINISPSNSKKFYVKINKISIKLFDPSFLL